MVDGMLLSRRTISALFLALPFTHDCLAQTQITRCRFRINGRLNFEGKDYAASSVIEVLWSKIERGSTGMIYRTQVWGEAPYARVDGIGNVFILLVPPTTYQGFSVMSLDRILNKFIPSEVTTNEGVRDGRYLASITSLIGRKNIPEKRRPRLMAFTNPSDVRTGRLVDDGTKPEVIVKNACIEVTSDPVTHSIAPALPWLRQEMPLPQLGKVTDDQIPFSYRVHKKCFLMNGEHT